MDDKSITGHLNDAIERGENAREMVKSDGWKELEQWINQTVTQRTLQLLDCPLDEVYEKRAEVKAFRSILAHVRDAINYGRQASEEVNR